MLIVIETNSELPIYEQIVRQVKFAVATGSLCPGDRVDSVRDLAKKIVVNPNTVARAYRDLQEDGVLETVRGQGLKVCSRALRRCLAERKSLIRERLQEVLREAAQSNLSREEIEAIVEEELNRYVPIEEVP